MRTVLVLCGCTGAGVWHRHRGRGGKFAWEKGTWFDTIVSTRGHAEDLHDVSACDCELTTQRIRQGHRSRVRLSPVSAIKHAVV
eukprot:2963797-Pleurochrysis_carterae.AAC.2